MNTRAHNWTVTINYFTEEDVNDMVKVCDIADYYIYGFEGIDEHDLHPHIHLFLHFKHAKSMARVLSFFDKHHHIEVVKDVPAMIEYCKGYEGGKLKSHTENVYIEYGTPPVSGVNKSSQQVIDAINEGKTIEEIERLYPSYCLHHYTKLQEYYYRRKQIDNTKGVIEHYDNYDPKIDEDVIYDFMDIVNTTKEVVVWYREAGSKYPKQMMDNYVKGLPLKVKYGYKFIAIKPKKIIVVTDTTALRK